MLKILFVSLGCDKNLVDSEVMLGLLSEKGYGFTDDETEADVIIVNTCCFIGDAKEESVNTILEMAGYKESGKCRVLLVAGCLAERYRQEIFDEIPEVDAVLGTASYDSIAEAVEKALEGQRPLKCGDTGRLIMTKPGRILTTGGHYAHLKIAEGCDKRCTYCIIPKLRGSYRSFPIEHLVEEAVKLSKQGVRELILVAQETTLYGTDLYGEKSLHRLLKELCRIQGIRWIRIQYCYPEEIYDGLIQVIKEEPKICHYLDLPIQHASDRILKRMGRRASKEDLQKIVGKLREEIPDICLRTTLISGFPGETQKDHEELMDFVDELEFDRLGVFAYSAEEGTPAAEMEAQVPEEIKQARREELMELQQEISFEKAEKMIEQRLWCMVEGKVADEDVYLARTYKDAPEVDGCLFIQTAEELMSGDFVEVKVTKAREYDLIGVIADEFTE